MPFFFSLRLLYLRESGELKGAIGRQAGLRVKADTSVTMSYTSVSVLTPLALDEAMRSDNSPNSLKCKSRVIPLNAKVVVCKLLRPLFVVRNMTDPVVFPRIDEESH